ncbi:MAG: alpha-N-acetylglucosaminidase [Bacteroidaceae bacterium]|nr:alpha-N-acetylglucosaminidase [Bacteroidaceae bacterium]
MKRIIITLTLLLMTMFTAVTVNAQAPVATPQEAIAGLLDRIGGKGASERIITVIDSSLAGNNGEDAFVITSKDGKPCINGNSALSVATGINWYLNHYAHINLTWNNLTTDLSKATLPVPTAEERHTSTAAYRYDFNTCTFSYSMAFWTWERWQKEIDWMALHGINAPLNLVGLDVVTRKFLREIGISESDINSYIAGPGFIAWFAMNNLEGWGGTINAKDVVMNGNPDWWYTRQEQLCRNMLQRMRELGMQPVIPGFSGQVPNCITNYTIEGFNKAHVINNGTWAGGYTRPDILNPASTSYKKLAPIYYKHLEEVMGVSEFYSMDPFHEGSLPSGVTNENCYPNVMKYLDEYFAGVSSEEKSLYNTPDKAKWIIQYWQGVPQSGAFSVMKNNGYADRFIGLDLFSDARGKAKWNTSYFSGCDFIFCMLHNFGGRSGMHGRLQTTMEDYFAALSRSNMKGVGATPEGIETNPILYDMLFELPWMDATNPPTIDEWLTEYTHARYGVKNETANAALKRLKESVWNCPTDQQGTSEAIILARPKWAPDRVSSWSTAAIYWDTQEVLVAADELISISDIITTEDGIVNYNYDVIDVVRQSMVDFAYELLPLINAARTESNTAEYKRLYTLYLQLMLDLDTMLSYDENFKLERWTSLARNIADEVEGTTVNDRNWLEWNARTQVTVWSKGDTDLHDYSNRCWAGLIKDFHYQRWKKFFESNGGTPSGGWYGGFEYPWTVNFTDLDYSTVIMPADMSATDKAKETFGIYFGRIKGEGKNFIFPMGVTRDASGSNVTPKMYRGQKAELPLEIGKETAITSIWVDLNGDLAKSSNEMLTAEGLTVEIPASAEIGRSKATVTFADGTSITFGIAIIEKITKARTVTVNAGANGSVTIEGCESLSVTNTEAVTLIATPNKGYNFSHWTNADGKKVSNSNPYTYYGKEAATFTANFIEDRWGVPAEDKGDWGDAAVQAQFVRQITFAYHNRDAEVIYETNNTPASLFNTVPEIMDVPRGASFDVTWSDLESDALKYCIMSAYIDMNSDGDFDDEGELLKCVGTHNAQDINVCEGSINVLLPYDIPLGITHMRLRFDGAWKSGYNSTTGAYPAKSKLNRMCYEIILNITEYSGTASHITVKANNSNWGAVAVSTDETPDGSKATEWEVSRGIPFTIEAVAAEGCDFICWKDRYGRVVSTEPIQDLFASEDATYTAVFSKGESRKNLGALIEDVETLLGNLATIQKNARTTKISLQANNANGANYIWSNAPDPQEGDIKFLVDGVKNNSSNFFHTNWHNPDTKEGYHYIEVDLGEENYNSLFQFTYNTRNSSSGMDYPDVITLMCSDDKQSYKNIETIDEGLPQTPGTDYTSGTIDCGKNYRYLRFKILAERTYWHMGEFGLSSVGGKSTVKKDYRDYVTKDEVEKLFNLMTAAKYVYENSADNDEIDATYNKLNALYKALLTTSDIKDIAACTTIGSIYDLSGRRHADNSDSGIYIIDGKKILTK